MTFWCLKSKKPIQTISALESKKWLNQKNKCHFSETNTVEINPIIAKEQDEITILVNPNFKINAPPNGANEAKIKYITPILLVTSDIPQP